MTSWSLQVVFKNQYDILWIDNMSSGKWAYQVLLCQEDAWHNLVHAEAAKEFILLEGNYSCPDMYKHARVWTSSLAFFWYALIFEYPQLLLV